MKMHPPHGQVVPFKYWMHQRDIRGINPCFKGKTSTIADIKLGSGWNKDVCVCVVEIKCLPHFAGGEANTALKRAVVVPDAVIRIPLRWPPRNQTRWSR